MKRHNLLFMLLFTITLIGSIFAQTVSQIILPQYIQGLNGTNDNRVPFVYRAKLDGLTPNVTYRFINQVIISTNGPTTSGAGNCIFVNPDNSFVRTSNPGFSTAGNYGEFITDASGSFTGWFITEPTGNARFTPGDYVFMRIRLNDGAGGTTAVTYLTLSDSIKVIDFSTASSGTLGTAIYGNSLAAAKDFVFLYDDEAGTGRPIASTLVESDGVDLSTVTSYALFYRDSVDKKDGYWGAIIPNQLPNGIRRIERRLLSDGSLHPVIAADADGIWPSGANTVDPVGGNTTPIRIELTDAPLPVELISFSAIVEQNAVKLVWKTSSELNNRGFEVERKNGDENWIKIGFVNGHGTTSSLNEYSFIDNNFTEKMCSYRLKQINIDGSYKYSSNINLSFTHPIKYQLEQNYPNPFNPSTIIKYAISSQQHVTLKVYNVLGNEVETLVNRVKPAGMYELEFNAADLASGIYFYKLQSGSFVETKKMILLR